jgi:hypothetical protein
MRRVFFAIPLLLLPQPALARPTAPVIFCEAYPDAPSCSGELPTCSTCHTSTSPPDWNAYGDAVGEALEGDFESGLPYALREIDGEDSDADGVLNSDEILVGTHPGDPGDAYPWCPPSPSMGAVPVADDYDFRRALRRVAVLYCGRSPTYAELATFDGDGPSRAELYARLHAVLSDCLASDAWTVTALRGLVDARIRPIGSVGADSPVGIVIGDYEWDYRLFRYVMTEDRDVRDLLLADYHVEERPDGTLARREGAIPSSGAAGQPLAPERRAGMITTSWFFAVNTMFSALPRTTAAQAYRAWLGMDIARQEGISPVALEPLDVDGRGVRERECAGCHSTLDPLSYAFASYNGISGPRTGSYDATRPARLIEGWSNPSTVLLGEPVADVRAWAEHAVTTEAFARNLAEMFFRHAMGREPTPGELAELRAIWRALSSDGWSANRMIHRVVDTSAFGAN